MNSKAHKHLSSDPVMKKLIAQHQIQETGEAANLFLELVDIITSQQLSLKAGKTIYNRVLSLLGDLEADAITAQHFLTLSHDQLRSAGLSNSKAVSVHHLANAVSSNHIILDHLKNLPDEEVVQQIVALKGLGPWSAEMFLMFSLNRPDIFAIGDLGLRTAVSNLYGIDREDKDAILELSKSWSPYRTLASRYLWASLNNS